MAWRVRGRGKLGHQNVLFISQQLIYLHFAGPEAQKKLRAAASNMLRRDRRQQVDRDVYQDRKTGKMLTTL